MSQNKLVLLVKKSRIRETPTLLTDKDSRTDTNLKRSRDLSKKNLKKSKKNEKSRNIYKKRRRKKNHAKKNKKIFF